MDALPIRGLTARALRFADKPEPAEIGGLLWGKIITGPEGKTIVIQQAEFIGADGSLFNATESGLERLSAAVARPRSELEPLGYFRSAVRNDVFPREQDKTFMESRLARQDSFALIVEPLVTGGCTAHFYFLENGRLQMQSSLLRVPLLAQAPDDDDEPFEPKRVPVVRERSSGAPNQALLRSPHDELVAADLGDLSGTDDQFTEHSSWSRGKTVFVAVLLLAMVGVSVYRILPSRARPAAVRTSAMETPIGLQVERRPDGQLDLTWNREFARTAARGGATLSIADGSYLRTLELSDDQLLSGKLAYFPKGDDIRFHFEMSIGGNRSIGESIRVVSPEVYASALPSASPRMNSIERTGAGIAGTATPGTFILTSRAAAPQAGGSTKQTPSVNPKSAAAPMSPVKERIITAAPPPISTAQAKGHTNPNFVTRIATPQSLAVMAPAPASAPQVIEPIRAVSPPPVTTLAKPVFQVMPNTKPFGYSLVNNDLQVDVKVHIDENGVVQDAEPLASNGSRSTMLTAQALIAARKWRFKPADVDGRKVPSTYVISFKFRKAP